MSVGLFHAKIMKTFDLSQMSMDRDSFSLLATRMRSTPITSPIEARLGVNCRWRMTNPDVGVNNGGKMLPGRGNIRGWRQNRVWNDAAGREMACIPGI